MFRGAKRIVLVETFFRTLGQFGIFEHIGTDAKIMQQFHFVIEGFQFGKRNGFAYANRCDRLLFVEQFPKQHDSAQVGMDQPQPLKQRTVLAMKIYRCYCGPGDFDQARNGIAPLGIRDFFAQPLAMRNLTCGKNH